MELSFLKRIQGKKLLSIIY